MNTRPFPPGYSPLLGVACEGLCICGKPLRLVYWQPGGLPIASLSYVPGYGLLHLGCAHAIREGRGLEVAAGLGEESVALRCLDLFSGAGGAARGLQQAGFHVTGVDIAPQPRYAGDVFVQGDALTFPLDGYDFVWASPPCQFASVCTPTAHKAAHPNLIPATRVRLQAAGVPYVIENVAGARAWLLNPIMLCGSMFGLGVWRHRYFECPTLGGILTPTCNHSGVPVLVSGSPRRKNALGIMDRTEPSTQARRDAMGIDWMSGAELDQAIPPAFSRFLGLQVIAALERQAA